MRSHCTIILFLWLCFVAGCRPGAVPDETRTPPAPDPASTPAEPTRVALTVDDLPWVGALPPGETRADATRRILEALERHGAEATAFVNCGRVERGSPVLRLWIDAGMSLGNHTAQHLDLNRAPLENWLRDVRTCDRFLRELTGEPFLSFRYPYLHEGQTADRWQAARDLLAELGSPVAHVTMDTADWVLASAYGAAIRRGDRAKAAEIGDAFVEHVVDVVRHYERVALDRVGRPIRHVMLLHANALVADHLEPLLTRLHAEGVELIPLAGALADPVYTLPNDYVGAGGYSWLYRFEPAAPELSSWDDARVAELRARFAP
jgi:peptidoglycan-N-acetylglucosamine deacetylase